MASTGRLTLKRGNPFTGTIRVKYSSGAVYDITGKSLFFTVKEKDDTTTNDDAALIWVDILPTQHTDPANGVTVLHLEAWQTLIPSKEYYWDVRVYKEEESSALAPELIQMNTDRKICEVVAIVTERI